MTLENLLLFYHEDFTVQFWAKQLVYFFTVLHMVYIVLVLFDIYYTTLRLVWESLQWYNKMGRKRFLHCCLVDIFLFLQLKKHEIFVSSYFLPCFVVNLYNIRNFILQQEYWLVLDFITFINLFLQTYNKIWWL